MFTIATNFDIKELDEFIELNNKYNLIDSFFGISPDLGVDGGRELFAREQTIDINNVIDYANRCNQNKIGFNFTFNSTVLTEQDLQNKNITKLLNTAHNNINSVTCASKITRDFLKSNYPKFNLIASRIFDYTTAETLNTLFKEYDLVVLPEQLNKDLELINKLKINQLVLITNSFCNYKCKNRANHYKLIGEYNKKINLNPEQKDRLIAEFMEKRGLCGKDHSIQDIEKVRIEPKDITKYTKLGIKHFKILDRFDPPTPLFVEEYLRGE